MEILLAWVSLGVCTLLGVACVALHLDGRGQRKALQAAQAAIEALEQRVAAHDAQLTDLTRDVGLLTADRDMAPLLPAEPEQHAQPAQTETGSAPGEGSQLRRITPAEVRLARQAWAEGRAPIELPPARITVKPGPGDVEERIARRYEELVQASEAAGQPASHCGGSYCFQAHADVSICTCDCAACRRAVEFLLQAQDEIAPPGKA